MRPVSVCVCLCVPASPSAGASLSTWDQCSPGRLLAQGDFPWGRGGSQGACEPQGVAGTDQEHQAAGLRRGGMSLGSARPSSLFLWAPDLPSAGESGRQASGRDVARACLLLEPTLEAPETRPPPGRCHPCLALACVHREPVGAQMAVRCRGSQCLGGHQCGCRVRAPVYLWVSVSLGLCCGIDCQLLRDSTGPFQPV